MTTMTKLEQRMAEVARITGKLVHIGKYGHNDDWYAHVDGVEFQGNTALVALESVIQGLKEKAQGLAGEAARQAKLAEGYDKL